MRVKPDQKTCLNLSAALVAILILFAGFFAQADGLAPKAPQGTAPKAPNKTAPKAPQKPTKKAQPKQIQAPQTPARQKTTNDQPAHSRIQPRSQQVFPLKSSIKTPAAPVASANPFGLAAAFVRSRSLYDHQDGSIEEANLYDFNPTWKFAEKWKFSALAEYAQDTRNSEGSDWADTQLAISHSPWKVSDAFSFGLGFAGLHPTSKKSAIVNTMKGGLGGSAMLGLNEAVLPKGISISTSASLLRLFYETEESTTGAVNNAWSSVQALKTAYSLGQWSFNFQYYHINALSFQNTVKEKFWHIEELDYNLTKTVSLAIGHTLAAPALRPNGLDSNVNLIDENKSLIYAQLGISL